jgi:glycosyltransferase involved in cell wall biosynthesis
MRVCAISFKECWRDDAGVWVSDGGFPLQMAGMASLFAGMTLLIVEGKQRPGGIPLPAGTNVVPIKQPGGTGFARKLSVIRNLGYYARIMGTHVRQADCVHIPVPGDLPLVGLMVALVLRKRLLVRYGGSWQTNRTTTFMNRATRTVMRSLAWRNDVLLATGEAAGGPAPGIKWIFSTALCEAELRNIKPCDADELHQPPRIVYIGRLSPEKGVHFLLRALATLQGEHSPRLTLIGDGPQRSELEALVTDLNCADRVTFAGQLTRGELSTALAQCDFCVQPSSTEGFSKAWIDAMAHGLPVLSTDVGAARAVIGEQGVRGWIVPAQNVEALANKIREVVTNTEDWQSLRRRCREYAQSRTLEAWARSIGERCAYQWKLTFHNGKLHA